MANEEHEGGDPAEAFEALRAEVAITRRIVEGLAAERARTVEVPDYSETLGHFGLALDGINGRLDAIVTQPALAMTPAQVSAQIGRAAAELRGPDQVALGSAASDMKQNARELDAMIGAVLTEQQQIKRQLWYGAAGLIGGILLWTMLPGLVAREIAPASWHWPERMAARTIAMPMWQAGGQMLSTADPALYQQSIADEQIAGANRTVIEGCQKAARKTRDPVRCTIRVRAE